MSRPAFTNDRMIAHRCDSRPTTMTLVRWLVLGSLLVGTAIAGFPLITKPGGLKVQRQYVPPGCIHHRRSKAGDAVSMNYVGMLQGSLKVFDSSRTPGRQPFQFTLGAGQVIKGWDEGLVGLCVGERLRLTIPPALGYGDRGYPGSIPPKATLLFDVEVMRIGRKGQNYIANGGHRD